MWTRISEILITFFGLNKTGTYLAIRTTDPGKQPF